MSTTWKEIKSIRHNTEMEVYTAASGGEPGVTLRTYPIEGESMGYKVVVGEEEWRELLLGLRMAGDYYGWEE